MDATIIARISLASTIKASSLALRIRSASTRSSIQNRDSSASSSTMLSLWMISAVDLARHDDRLRINHFAHHSAGAVGGAHQHRAEIELLSGDSLQATEQRVRRSIASGKRDPEPAKKRAEEWKQPSRSRECQPEHRVHAGI